MEILSLLGTVSGLALVASINPYFPLLIIAIATRVHFWQTLEMHPMFPFMTSDWFLGLCVALVLLNFVADKIPGVSGLWNSIHVVLRPLAGALVASALGPSDLLFQVFSTILGVGLAVIGTLTKLTIRTTASLATGGCASPLLGLVEDGLVVIMSLIALLLPVIMLVVVPVCILLFILFAPRLWDVLRSQWEILSSWIVWCVGIRSNGGVAEMCYKLTDRERTHLFQIVAPENIYAGIPVLWIRSLSRGKSRGDRSLMLFSWLIMTHNDLILFPPKKPQQAVVIPSTSIQWSTYQAGAMKGSFSIMQQGGIIYRCIITRTAHTGAVAMLHHLQGRHGIPAGTPSR
jgi:hypothetical protein